MSQGLGLVWRSGIRQSEVLSDKVSQGRRAETGEVGSRGGRGRLVLTQGLKVEGHKLAAHVPEELGHVVGGVHAGALGVDAAELLFIVSEVGSQGPCSLPAPAPGPPCAPVNPLPGL